MLECLDLSGVAGFTSNSSLLFIYSVYPRKSQVMVQVVGTLQPNTTHIGCWAPGSASSVSSCFRLWESEAVDGHFLSDSAFQMSISLKNCIC